MHSDTWDVGFHQKMRAKCYCMFSDSEPIHRTTYAKELANSIVAVTQQCPCLWEGVRWVTNPVRIWITRVHSLEGTQFTKARMRKCD